MDFTWFFVEVVVILAIIYTAREIARRWRRKRPECVVPLRSPRFHSIDAARRSSMPERRVKRISTRECENLVRAFDNVVFIALRQESKRTPLPSPAIHAVSIAPSELVDVLNLIPDCYVVLCGEIDACPSILKTIEGVVRSAPVYLLDAAAVSAEAV
jgi:hypothetical protein